jgi:hypothetical protein
MADYDQSTNTYTLEQGEEDFTLPSLPPAPQAGASSATTSTTTSSVIPDRTPLLAAAAATLSRAVTITIALRVEAATIVSLEAKAATS